MGKYEGQSSLVTLWIILAAAVQVVISQPILTSSVEQVCPGNTILFTCTTTGSSTLTWSSEDYIGSGRQLQFRSIDDNGTVENSPFNPETIATLTAINPNGPILMSILRIIARPTTPNISVSCTNARGETSTLAIPLAAVPDAPRNVRAAQVSQDNDNSCIILVTWDPPTNVDVSDIDHYIITVPSRNITETESSAIIALRIRNCDGNDSIQVAAVNRFGCIGENSLQTRPSLLDSIAITTGSTTSIPIGSTSASVSVIAAASVAAVLFIVLCFVVVLGLVLFSVLYKRGKKVQNADQVLLSDVFKLEEHVDEEIDDLQNRFQDTSVKRNLEELYNALKLKLAYRNTIQTAARDLRETLTLGVESSIFNEKIKDAFISYLEKLQSENREDVQRVTENMDTILTGMTGIEEEIKTSVRLLRTEVGAGEYTKVLNDLIKKVEKVQPDTIVRILRILCENLRKIRQVKDYYCKQSKYDIDKLGSGNDRVTVPIWMDDELDGGWKAGLHEAVKAINEAAPGLSLSITEDKKKAIIHALAIDKKEPYTEVEGNILIRSSTENFVTKICLGKIWKDDGKKGVCTHKLLHALGFHHDHQDAIAEPYILYHLDSGKQITIDKNDLCFIQWESSTTTLYPCEKKCREHSEDHVCKWVLDVYPTKVNTDLNEHDMVGLNLVYRPCVDKTASNIGYRPKLGKNGLYYCGREVMIGLTFHGEEYDHLCGPDKGPNCPACRTIMSPRLKEILDGGRWQGVTGRVYCGRPFAEPGILFPTHNGMCGIDNGPACPDCNNILNKEHVQVFQ